MLRVFSSVILLAAPAICEVAGDWPRWRGPFDTGMARGDVALRWSDSENIAWKIAIPGLGNSSPVIWENRLFLTTALPTEPLQPRASSGSGGSGGRGAGDPSEQPEHSLIVMAIDRRTGKVLWQQTARKLKPHEGFHQRYGSHASNSPVTDGKRVYAFFGSHGAYAYDLDGKLLWEWDPGLRMRMRLGFGEGTAAVLDKDTLLLNFDHEGEDFLAALDASTGKLRWKMPREEPSSWSAPLVVEHEGVRQVVVSASNKVRAYDIVDGKLIWECAGLGSNVIPAPVASKGIVYVMSGHRDPKLMAIKLGRKGDLTGTDAIVWSTTRGASYTPSPVLHDGKLYALTDSGMLSCFDAATGKPYYERMRLPKPYSFKSSPIGVNGKLYLSTEDGDVVVVRMGETFEVLATNTLTDQSFIATPAVAGGDLYLRSQTHLFCVRPAK